MDRVKYPGDHKCPECNLGFVSEKGLEIHIELSHGGSDGDTS